MSDFLEITRAGRLLRLTLNRPEKRNALDSAFCRDLVNTLDHAEADPAVGAILLQANGKHFCAGMDLTEVGGARTAEINTAQEQLFTIGSRLTKPLVAAVHGASLGGGMGLVGNCHVVVAHPEATFGLTEIRIGLWPFLVFRALSAALGERRVVELALTGRIFGALEARELGLVHEVSLDFQGHATEMAAALAESSPTAIRTGLAFVHEARGLNWTEGGEIARKRRDEVFASSDFAEGRRAFQEKRAPLWPSLQQEHH